MTCIPGKAGPDPPAAPTAISSGLSRGNSADLGVAPPQITVSSDEGPRTIFRPFVSEEFPPTVFLGQATEKSGMLMGRSHVPVVCIFSPALWARI